MTYAYLSQRIQRIGFSPNSAASQRAKQLKADGRDILDLTIGEPDFDTPEHVKEAAREALARNQTRYTPALGTAHMREAVREKLARENQLEFPLESIAITNGGKQAIYNAFAASLDPGHEVIVPIPYYPSFPEMVKANDGTPVFLSTTADTGFKPTSEQWRAAIGPKTRWLVINTPSNPSGAVYDEDDFRAVAELLREHPHVLLLLDEVYEHIRFASSHPHFLHVAPDLRERVLIVNACSKAYAMTGWRVGYAAGPQALIAAMGIMQIQSTSGVSSISQAAGVAALRGPQALVGERSRIYHERRDILLAGLAPIPGIKAFVPLGGFFVLSSWEALRGRRSPAGKVLASDEDFVDYLLEAAGVAGVPGSAYGLPGHFRLSIATATEDIRQAGPRIAAAIAQLSGAPLHA
ncbi:pyridoxal phosphate-dependent aminotransferase [Uliginosibacterium gangwonense]|uniref:pyridoxal phosphate-dependent aminotransferase n=1 Tax=Uliginosibacterium gangwonense TaxID=392736 RepID=UPI0003681053|nr:pyridoxal phosphate-dependent aminotransferase [Uliginosibacterium gangwonense]